MSRKFSKFWKLVANITSKLFDSCICQSLTTGKTNIKLFKLREIKFSFLTQTFQTKIGNIGTSKIES